MGVGCLWFGWEFIAFVCEALDSEGDIDSLLIPELLR
jgi:hypothetical protein